MKLGREKKIPGQCLLGLSRQKWEGEGPFDIYKDAFCNFFSPGLAFVGRLGRKCNFLFLFCNKGKTRDGGNRTMNSLSQKPILLRSLKFECKQKRGFGFARKKKVSHIGSVSV